MTWIKEYNMNKINQLSAISCQILAVCGMLLLTGCPDTTTHAPHQPGATVTRDAATKLPNHFERVSFSNLPGWREDDVRYALRAFRQTCSARVNYSGSVVMDRALLEEKCRMMPSESADVATVRAWFESHFQPYRVRDERGASRGTFTGYYSPTINACRHRTAHCNEPLMGLPTNGQNIKGIPREEIVRKQIGKPLFWANIVDVQNIQIQGSGMLRLEDGSKVKLNFAAVNDMPFRSIGEQLRNRGIRPAGGFSSEGVWEHLRKNPELAREVINNNPRYVWFKVAEKHDVIGAMNVPLSSIRSIAIDNTLYSLGMPVFVDTRLSDGTEFRRLMIAQDTGGAIRGWVRVDLYFGEGDAAYKYAQGQHHQGEKFILMPKVFQR
jgi:membrane-bound lytic murein transglycosylase A